ncbi:MAG TPA: DUF932 domain-containing protein [Terriglobia bacterium]|nr:DUF932 domain-containing protein [Terriglobia bacterium]
MTLIAHCGTTKISREELRLLPVPPATATHKPIPHHEVVQALIETLGFRHISVVFDEYAVSPDGMKMFGSLDLDYEYSDVRFSIGVKNAHDKSMRLALTIGYRTLVCDNMAFKGDFTPILHKHTKNLDLIDLLSVGVDKMQRNFDPLKQQIDDWKTGKLIDDQAKVIIYEAFVEQRLPMRLLPSVHQHYFQPAYEAFAPRTMWSLSNAFTSSFKKLTPIRQFQLTAKLGSFLSSPSLLQENFIEESRQNGGSLRPLQAAAHQ